MGRLISYNVEEDYDGENVYKFLREKAKISYRLLKSLKQIPKGIMLNGEHIRTVDIIHTGDVLSVDIPCPESEIEPVEMPLEILYEDSDLLIINKDPFIACHPTHNHQGDTLANAVAYYLKSKNKNSVFRAVGRLDKGTSGIVICALNKHCAAMIPGNVEKEYLAIINGQPEKEGTINAPIYRPDPMKTIRAVGEGGDYAVTHWNVIKQNEKMALAKINLETGRTHQIRVHMSKNGHPIVGDPVYGRKKEEFKLKGQLLHAWKVGFIHPITGEYMEFEREVPEYFECVLESLRRRSI